ncbi:signal peptidase I [Leadbettera azotonutricia]|uniref:Signal peptidase I n=1 Tax=Leadbettera azotonutricia (strain ATCC BAA-888 / DSM 13862 / ZAS-9) TaxID=545695 RepID=F5YCV7_LEAAZ|nr:signal peptidase I [Leadbettera azotonutricia]AEF83466.1 signal peptidase I [Leadbettera azotonutricia ZAS-9]
MFGKKRGYSFAEQKNQRHRIRWILLWVFVFFAVYTSLTSLVFSMRVLENGTMEPGLHAGDRFIFSSYKIYSFIPGPDMEKLPFKRGNVVLVDTSLGNKRGFFSLALDGVLRFFTAQRFSLERQGEQVYLKRVIGLPGDEITMTNFVIRVKPKGDAYSFTEFELWDTPYEIDIPQVPALWDNTLPFSGNMERVVLGSDECFVLSDDRSNTNDSRTWGPVPVKHIAGKVLFRYWPFTKLGQP